MQNKRFHNTKRADIKTYVMHEKFCTESYSKFHGYLSAMFKIKLTFKFSIAQHYDDKIFFILKLNLFPDINLYGMHEKFCSQSYSKL